MSKYKLVCVVGARPNFMKMGPLINVLRRDPGFEPILVHTGQHYDDTLAGRFFRDLGLPAPDYPLCVGSGSHAEQSAEIMKRFEPVLLEERPDAVVVAGDVNSTMACAVVAAKLRIPVVHIEAGLRSFDRSMPEEVNRIITDAIADVLLVTEESGRFNLLREGIPEERIYFVGNLMIDSLREHLKAAHDSTIVERLGLPPHEFALVTLHRPANVDHPRAFAEILGTLAEISRTLPMVFPVHPRTRAALDDCMRQKIHNVLFCDALGYLDFLCLMSNSRVVFTDSGGIQEETTALGVPCLTLRENTERPVTVERGTNLLAGTKRSSILAAWNQMKEHPKHGCIPPLWDGTAAFRCLGALTEWLDRREARGDVKGAQSAEITGELVATQI